MWQVFCLRILGFETGNGFAVAMVHRLAGAPWRGKGKLGTGRKRGAPMGRCTLRLESLLAWVVSFVIISDLEFEGEQYGTRTGI